MATNHPTCQRPDRDEPRITCGYPLPCPHHTILFIPGTGQMHSLELRQIEAALLPLLTKKRKPRP